jgi:transposase
LHADANGAYNIVRRACPAFKVHAKLSPRFGLFWLSPCGLRALGQKASPKLEDRKIAAKEASAKAAALPPA